MIKEEIARLQCLYQSLETLCGSQMVVTTGDAVDGVSTCCGGSIANDEDEDDMRELRIRSANNVY
jgi:hypothetical protein